MDIINVMSKNIYQGVDKMHDKLNITGEYTENFYTHLKTLSHYISELKMCKKTNDELVNLIFKQLELAEKEAFMRGFKFGMEYNFDNLFEQEEHLFRANQDEIHH